MQTTELFKTFQDVIIPERPAVHCSVHSRRWWWVQSATLLTHRIGRLQNHHIPQPTDEPCRQSCAARGRPRLSYREHHWIAPVRLTAAQSGPWLRPATYRPSRTDTTHHAEPPDKGHPEKTQKRRTNSKTNKRITPCRRTEQKEEGQNEKPDPGGRLSRNSVLSHPSEDCYFSASQTKTTGFSISIVILPGAMGQAAWMGNAVTRRSILGSAPPCGR